MLYIPHGSDESRFSFSLLFLNLSFISHMVQMKDYPGRIFIASLSNFISHMVQMKDAKRKSQYSVICKLYIPHGSDERITACVCKCGSNSLYIPHGSDESYALC